MADDIFIQSREKALNGFGQNGFQKASSDLPGNKTNVPGTSRVSVPQVTLPQAGDDWQTRKIDASPIAAHPGMSARQHGGTVPANGRPVTRKI